MRAANTKHIVRHRKGKTHDAKRDADKIPRSLPQLQDQLSVGMTLRFITTTSFLGVLSVTAQNLLDAWFVAGTATTAYDLFDYVKVKRVTIRGMSSGISFASGVNVAPSCTVGVEFYGLSPGTYSGGKVRTNTSLGYDEPAYVSVKPDPQSQAAQFQPGSGSNTATMFLIRAVDQNSTPVSGVVIDVEVVFRNSPDINPAALGTARSGLTPGNIYFGGLDGVTDATTQARSAFQPRA